ncbi:Flavin-binding monooxygenase-like family protein [Cladophialophora carrionii]|uniref:Flavin-binding monooxygenase-like family protein n=1 Tax=Cladophialophora carrionii TaxID=86049 RepID=A0A1C1C782_9EURO|nr:Flavin-binding monooxygenase-like family protein [Cladophialophora carrionii]
MAVDVAPYAPRSILETLPCHLPQSHFDVDADLEGIATPIIQSLGQIEASKLSSTSIWRDLFALTGSMRTIYSPHSIVRAWSDTCKSRQAGDFALVKGSAQPLRLDKNTGWVNVSFSFRNRGNPAATCRGYLSLILEDDGQWRIWMIRTVLEQLEGCEDVDVLQPVERARDGVNGHDTSTQAGRVNGNHTLDDRAPGATTGPTSSAAHFDCVVVGAGQAGLGTAGRLQALGLSYVVLDKNAQVGDNWMTRYDSARLHTAREYNHLPFDRTFPLPYQEFLTKYDLAKGYKEWVDKFGIAQHICFRTTLDSGSWDEQSRTWTLHVSRADGSVQTLTADHVVMATGGGGQIPIMPHYPGRETFQGTVLHSADYKSAAPWRGQPGIVIGTANTAHDVAEDMVEAALSHVTMVQRSRTYVLPCEYFKVISDRSYNAQVATVDADRDGYTMPYAVTRLLSRRALHAAAAREPERFDALERVGFRVERYGDIMWHICEKLGGHYMDVGCSDLIAKGKIKMKSDALPTHYTPTGLAFSDGTEIPAAVIVFSTGFVGNMRTDVARIFGKEVASRADDFWGLDSEGELKGVFKKNRHPGLWYTGGTVGHARYFSRFVALQIKADKMGTPLPVYDGERRTETLDVRVVSDGGLLQNGH